MQIIIAEYETLAQAQQAVLALEREVSVQRVVIRDQAGHWWKQRDLKRDRSLDHAHRADFVVSVGGTPENIERARALLRARRAAAPA